MNTFGRDFKVSIFGESHGVGVGVVIDGVPSGISFTEEDMLPDLDRRRSGAKGTTPRKESDLPKIISGVFNGKTTGAPLAITFENSNTRSKDYSKFREMPRPGHADFVASQKYGGFEDYRGGGHFSGRLTLALVAAGALAKKVIGETLVNAEILEVGGNTNIEAAINKAIEENDSIGGLIQVTVTNIPIGLGEPFFDSAEAMISHMMFSVPAIKGIEFGSGFAAARMRGTEHNDNIIDENGTTETNYAAGINGGITNGNDIVFRIAVKPTSSTSQPQQTYNVKHNQMDTLKVEGRHDLCIALRVPVVAECATAIVMADLMLQAQKIGRVINK